MTFTCTATQVSSLSWVALPLLNEDDTAIVFASSNASGQLRVIHDVFVLSVVTVDNLMGVSGDITSTLSIVVDGVGNGTNVSCKVFSETKSLIILKDGQCHHIT